MPKNRTITFWGGFFLIFFILKFYCPIFIEPFLLFFNGKKYCLIMTLLPLFFIKGHLKNQKFLLKKQIVIYLSLAVLNIFTCYYFRGQPIWVSYWMWIPFFLILYYPVFLTWNWNIQKWEKIIECLYYIFLVCFILQFLFRNTYQLFVLDTQFEYLEFESRVRIYSDAILYLGSFYSLCKYLSFAKSKYLSLFIIGSVCVFLQGFRMLILCYIIISGLMFVRVKKISLKSIFVVSLFVLGIGVALQTDMAKDKVEEITSRNERAQFDDDSYVRVMLTNYYYTSHFNSNIELILGSGIPHINSVEPGAAESSYSRECSYNAVDYHYFPADMGLLGLSWNAGIPFAICFILFLISIARVKIPHQEYLYIGAWELFLVMIGLTNELSYNHSNILYQAIVLTIVTLAVRKDQPNLDKKKYRII